jgi:WD40 repeat protein
MRTMRRGRWAFARWAGLCLSVLLLAAGTWARARELSTMNGEEIKGLQQRLTDAGCYAGPVDGGVSSALAAATRACPDQDPVLRIETGMHVAPVKRIGVDAQCRLAATASDDKTVRLWSLPDGKPLRILRPPIGAGDFGKVYAVAMSPDGRFVAVGGFDAHAKVDYKAAVSIFETTSGDLIARVGAFENAIQNLAFSRDGRWLAATLGGGAGLRVIDAANWREVAADRKYGDRSEGAGFGPDGRLYTVASDGKIRVYGPGPQFKRQMAINAHSGKEPVSVAVDPRGERIAVGFRDTTAVDLYDASSLAFLTSADTRGIDGGNLFEVSWRADGEALIAGGYHFDEKGKRPLFLFDRDGRRLDDPPAARAADTILNLAPCGDGFVVAAADPAFGLLDGKGRVRFWLRGVSADMRFKVGSYFTIAEDAKSVRFGLGLGEQPVLFDLRRATLGDSPTPPPGLSEPDTADLPIANWFNQPSPTFGDRPILLKPHETSHSLAIRPGGRGFVLGTEWSLRGFDAGAGWVVPAAGPVWGVNVSADDRLVVAAYGDGTIRWHRVADGRELLALFVNRETKTWVAWTPTGYYMASPGGEDLIGWHVNRGWIQAADFFPASRFRDRFDRPDIVQLVLDTLDEDAAVKQANAKAHRREDVAPLTAQLPPLIRISDPPDGGRVGTAEAKLDYVWRSPSGLPVDAIEVLIDGRPVKEETLRVRPADANAEIHGSLTFPLPPHDAEVGLIAYSGEIASEAARVKLTWTGAVAPNVQPRRLHALIAGVSDYASPDMALAYAAKDASDFAHALEGQKGGYYSEVETRVLVDRQVTRENLIDGLDWLAKEATGPDDYSVLFLAGHGLTDEKQTYWFLPSDATEDQAHSKGLSQDDVRRALRSAPGKVIWFLDTCHAGGAATRSPVDLNILLTTVAAPENGGIVAFASSKGSETSVESSTWKNGAFTKALVEGIELGKAIASGRDDDAITTLSLESYVEFRVTKLTDGEQHPNMLQPLQQSDFTLAQARKP